MVAGADLNAEWVRHRLVGSLGFRLLICAPSLVLHHRGVTYRERSSVVPGVVEWQRDASASVSTRRILPDGCMDLIWDGSRLFVAGPDTRARWHESSPNVSYIGLRFSCAIGPALVGTPADELRDTTADLESLWPSKRARFLAEQVGADPKLALERWLVNQRNSNVPAELGTVVFELAARSVPVAVMADKVGMSVRQLHRRCLPLFGYGLSICLGSSASNGQLLPPAVR